MHGASRREGFGYRKGDDTAGFRIRDQSNEIMAFRKARILTVAECVYRALGFNVNYRLPAVVVCPMCFPRGLQVEELARSNLVWEG